MTEVVQVTPCYSVRVQYVSQQTATYKEDIIHVHPNWQSSGPRRDWVLTLAGRSRQAFSQLLYLFSFIWKGGFHSVAFDRTHSVYKRDELSDYIQLPDAGRCEFMLADSIICYTHVLPPIPSNPHHTVQDPENDMIFRLLHVNSLC